MIDGYKTDHRSQYPNKTTLVYSNFTARKSRIEKIDHIVFFGLQYFIKEYLVKQWNDNFFNRPKQEVVNEYKRRIDNYLGPDIITYDHIEYLHDLGYLPLVIKAVPEGSKVSIGVPCLTLYNTDPECFWLTNYFETILSCVLWKPITSATIANHYRATFDRYADLTGGNKDFVPFQGHDFSFRGLSGFEDACVNGAAHLTSFLGTDTIPAVDFIEKYYNGDCTNEVIGVSVSATEHSVQSLGTEDFYNKQDESLSDEEKRFLAEVEVYRRLITEVYPKGIVSIVSDTYDFWGVIDKVLPLLKNTIVERERRNPGSKVVIRPDSGVPEFIINGDPNGKTDSERVGAIQRLWEIFGGENNEKGYKVLDPCIGLIYGDSITMERQTDILQGMRNNNFASTNVVMGIGSFTYQYNTRDTFGFTMKATYGEVDGQSRDIYKDPKTGGWKKSHRGLLKVYCDGTVDQQVSWDDEKAGMLEVVFDNGHLVREHTFEEIRERISQNRFKTTIDVGCLCH